MFIGRDRELASARSQLSLPDVAGVVLVGDAGVGKSALAEAIVTSMDSVNALRVYGAVGTADLPFGSLSASLPAHLGRELVSPPQALREVIQEANDPVVLLVDDADQVDRASAEALAQVIDAGGAVAVVTHRRGTTLPPPLVRLRGGRALQRIEVGPLDVSALASLAETILGAPLSQRSLVGVQKRTLGNPLYVVELLRVARDEGCVDVVGGEVELRGIPATSDRLVDLVSARLEGLAETEIDVLARVAAATPTGPGELGIDVAPEVLERLVDRGLLASVRDGRRLRLRLGHPIHGEVLRAAQSPLVARRIRTEIARSIETHGGRRREDRMRLATWSLDGDHPVNASRLIEAAESALLAADTALAVRLAVAGFEADPRFDTGRVTEVALYEHGAVDQLFAHHRRWAELAETEEERTVFEVAVAKGAFWRAMDTGPLDELIAALPPTAEAGRVTTLRAEAAAMLVLRGHIHRSLDLAEPHIDDPPTRESVLFGLALGHGHRAAGRPETSCAVLDRLADTFSAIGDNVFGMSENVVSSARTQALAEAGRFDESEASSARSLQLAQETDAHKAQGLAYLAQGWSRYLAGRHADADRSLISSIAALQYVAHPGMVRWACGARALLHASTGDIELARSMLDELDAEAHPAEIFESNIERAQAWVLFADGETELGTKLLTERADLELDRGNIVAALGCLLDLARLGQAHLGVGLLERVGSVEGDLLPLYRSYIEARADRSPPELARVAEQAARCGVPVLAAELMEQAALEAPDETATQFLRRAMELRSDAGVAVEDQPDLAVLRLLTEREREIGVLAAQGYASKAIGERLRISPRTVDTHLARVYQKLGVNGRSALARLLVAGRR